LTLIFYGVLFAYINKNVEEVTVGHEKRMGEFKQYKNMFDCLQEGILVLKHFAKTDENTKHKIFFVNDIGNRILKKVFKIKDSSIKTDM